MKPLGLAMDALTGVRIVRPDDAQDAIYAAVEKALDTGMSVEQFRREAAECWNIVQAERMKSDAQVWQRNPR